MLNPMPIVKWRRLSFEQARPPRERKLVLRLEIMKSNQSAGRSNVILLPFVGGLGRFYSNVCIWIRLLAYGSWIDALHFFLKITLKHLEAG